VSTAILAIEDNPDNMELFAWILEDEGNVSVNLIAKHTFYKPLFYQDLSTDQPGIAATACGRESPRPAGSQTSTHGRYIK
jgi:hypothetical protein